MAKTKSKTKSPAKPKGTKRSAAAASKAKPSRRTSSKATASKTRQPKSQKPGPAAAAAGSATIKLSEPLAQGTQIVATITGLTPGETVVAHLEGPAGRSETSRLRADPGGLTQVFVHGPRVGTHSISIKADSGHAHTEFEVV